MKPDNRTHTGSKMPYERLERRDEGSKMSSKDAALVLLLIVLCIMALAHERMSGAATFSRVTDKDGVSYLEQKIGTKTVRVAQG